MKMKNLISLKDFKREDLDEIFSLTEKMKKKPYKFKNSLQGKTLAMIFTKPSTRTRVSFEVGIYQLGGYALYLSSSDIQLGRGETISDTGKVLSRYVNGIMARVHSHSDIENLSKYSDVPVINGLSDFTHPCQGLTDYFTIFEKKGGFKGIKMAYVGDCNNVCHSLIFGASILGIELRIATPSDYKPKNEILKIAEGINEGAKIILLTNPQDAVVDADVVYTDVWVSMGMEKEKEKRLRDFRDYQINKELFSLAKKDAIFMHCLPAHRGEEVSDEVIDSPQSVVFEQAENRLHVQKAILLLLMGREDYL